jgi:hypothetical protein
VLFRTFVQLQGASAKGEWEQRRRRRIMAVAHPAVEPADHHSVSVEDIKTLIERLVSERQRLRLQRAARAELEANRLAIVYWHRRLGLEHALRARS